MKQVTRRAFICALLGAIMSYVVGGLLPQVLDSGGWEPVVRSASARTSDPDGNWSVVRLSTVAVEQVRSEWWNRQNAAGDLSLDAAQRLLPVWFGRDGFSTESLRLARGYPNELFGDEEIVLAIGWPARSSKCWLRMEWYDSDDVEDHRENRGEWSGLLEIEGVVRLPWIPIWGGLLLNTTCYGGVFAVVWFMPGAIKRALRRRRGACARCGYDLRGGERVVCPECGDRCEPSAASSRAVEDEMVGARRGAP